MLKASFEVLQPASQTSFLVRSFEEPVFSAPYHYHPEYELTLIVQGQGKRYVGNNMSPFVSGDLVLLGSNVPHCWKTEMADSPAEPSRSIVVQFSPDFLGERFFASAEMHFISMLLDKSSNGIQFTGETRRLVADRLHALSAEDDPFNRLILFLSLLQQLSLSTEYTLLEQKAPVRKNAADLERINQVFVYLIENFRHSISLDKAAASANMTPNAFCKYFKKMTRKTFMETVIGYRLQYATQQLIHTDKPVATICFDSGFGDVSHFYKIFKAKMGISPLHYRKKFMEVLIS